ncbi:MAG: hypothetical protein KAS16_03695 [Thermoplasmata archaeon]|nr:hypothetical protein [Thermoplasmata archaeon]
MTNHFSEQIESLLTPLLGNFMATMAVKSQCRSLGITPEDIGAQHLEELSGKVGQALAIHGNKEETDRIIRKIKSMR